LPMYEKYKTPEFYMKIGRKIFSRIGGGGTCPSYFPRLTVTGRREKSSASSTMDIVFITVRRSCFIAGGRL